MSINVQVDMGGRFMTAQGMRSEFMSAVFCVDDASDHNALVKAAIKEFVARQTKAGRTPTGDVTVYYWEVRKR